MTKSDARTGEDSSSRRQGTPTPDEIRAQLRSILASPIFHSSRRGQQFIEYVVERALAGDVGALKERTIAVEVFGRSPDSGLAEDSIVRVGAREVRKRLAQYYMTPDGAAAPIVMDLPSGSYVPEFRYAAAAHSPVIKETPASLPDRPAAEPQPLPAGRAVAKSRSPLLIAIPVVAVLGVIAFLMLRPAGADPRTKDFQKFWAPALDSSTPLLIGVGHPIVYQPSTRASRLSASRTPPTPVPIQAPLNLKPNELDGSDIVPVLNQFVGFGDMVAANEVSQMMARHSRSVRVLLASSIPFADLRQSPVYLIGSLSNRWSMELGQNWQFQFQWTPEHKPIIIDTATHKQWTMDANDDGSAPEDYSLICRIRNSPTGGLLIVSAGIKQFGTEAAGRILAQPVELSQILGKMPAGWEDKNLQIVLRTRIIGNTPAQPEVVASHVW